MRAVAPLVLAFHKPYGVISQFTAHPTYRALADFGFPKDVYPIGRLDADSEGLLLLSNDGRLAHELIDPIFRHERTYWVQVEGIPSAAALGYLSGGIFLDGKKTRPAKATIIVPPNYPERIKPIRVRREIPTSWIELSLTEGRNRQVRRMTAAVGHPTLRLIRVQIATVRLASLEVGTWRPLTAEECQTLRSSLKLTIREESR